MKHGLYGAQRGGMKLWAVMLALVVAAAWGPLALAAAPPVYNFHLIQGQASLPGVAVYADITGANETPAKGIKPEDLKVSLGPAAGGVKRIVPFEDSGEGIGYVLLVDVSKSLSEEQFGQMKETLAAFVDSMSAADQAALIIFGSEVKTVQDFTANRSKIKDGLAALRPMDEDTAFYSAIERGIAVARAGDKGVPRRRVVITLTDGINDFAGGVGKDDVVKLLEHDPVTLYLIGFFQGRPTAAEEDAIGVMKQFSRSSGGRYYDGREDSWRGIYFAISRAIRSSFLIEMEVPDFRSEGRIYPLEMNLVAANRTWIEKLQLTVPAGGTAMPAKNEAAKDAAHKGGADKTDATASPVALYAGTAALLILAAIFWFRRRKTSGGGAVSGPEERPALEAGVWVRLTRIHEGPPPNQFELEIDSSVIIGSDPRVSHLVLDTDSRIAPAHCEIVFEAGRLHIRDLGTEQGTFLNGVAVTDRQIVEEQDVLRLGGTELRITFPVES